MALYESNEEKVKRYKIEKFLGEGQFAHVYQAKDSKTGATIAIKKIKLGSKVEADDGINRTALREIKLLPEVRHPNIVELHDVFYHGGHMNLVIDFMNYDLEMVVRDRSLVLTSAHIKAYMIMTLRGLEYLHNNWVLHRDLKPNNLLMDKHGLLKIADFGLAKFYGSPSRDLTHQVVTRWYRAPELLYGAKKYGTGVDLWAVGCIVAEMLLKNPLFPGETDIDQLCKIHSFLGTPNEDDWPAVRELAGFIEFKPMPAQPMESLFTAVKEDLREVLRKMLQLNPLKRCTATEALKMAFFSHEPAPTPGPRLPRPREAGDVSEDEKETRRKELRRKLVEDSSGQTVKRLFASDDY